MINSLVNFLSYVDWIQALIFLFFFCLGRGYQKYKAYKYRNITGGY